MAVRKGLPFPGAYWQLVVVIAALGQAIVLMDRTALYPLLPVVGKDLHLSGAQAGAIASVYGVIYVAAQIPGGALGDRLGLKRMLVASLTIAGLGLLAVGLLVRSYPLILVPMAVHGLGAGATWPLANGMATEVMPSQRRGASISFLYTGGSLGMVLGLGIPAVLYTVTGHWWVTFLFLSVATLLLAAFAWLALHESTYAPAQRGLGSLKPIFTHRHLVVLCLANTCSLYGMWVVLTWSPSYLAVERGLSLPWAGAFTALVALMAIPGAQAMGRLSDRWGRKALAVVTVALAAATIVALVSVRSPGLTVGLLAVYGLLGPMALGPVTYAWLVDLVTDSRLALATAIGTFSAISMVSSFVAPLLSGWIWDITGSLQPAFYAGAGAVSLGALLMLIPRETVTRRRRPSTPPEVASSRQATGPAMGTLEAGQPRTEPGGKGPTL